jgi:DNA polymerase I-like protein with 3'-5' exonuclease and polymerase domains
MVKLATVLIRWYIRDNRLTDKVRIVAQVHDQNTTIAKTEYAEEWKPIMTSLMEEGAKVFITNGLLKSETTNTGSRWSK